MGQLLVVAVSKATFILVACATLALLSVSGCGSSQAYKEGYENAIHYVQDMSNTSATSGTSFSAKELPDPEEIEAETGQQQVPYPKGSSDRKEWVRGYRDAMKKAISDGY